jgi:hypothetical protein
LVKYIDKHTKITIKLERGEIQFINQCLFECRVRNMHPRYDLVLKLGDLLDKHPLDMELTDETL